LRNQYRAAEEDRTQYEVEEHGGPKVAVPE
jgi:hypothetical protein